MSDKASLLVIVAHPDDIDIVSGGAIAKWVREGEVIQYCIVTDGSAGSPNPKITTSEIAEMRRREQEKAASSLGVTKVHFLGLADGHVQPSLDLRRQLVRLIRISRPQRILTHAPSYNLKSIRFSHPDHLAVGQATLAAVFPDARNPHAFKETELALLSPHIVEEVWMMGVQEPDTFIDITEYLDAKLKAISCHTSQLSGFGDLYEFFFTWGRELAYDAGFAEDRLAEAFYVINTK